MPKINVKDARRKQLMEANIASIVKHGIAGTTITHVAGGANMSRGIVNFYFTSKDTMMHDTLRYLVRSYEEETEAALADPGNKTAGDRLRTWLKVHFGNALCSAKRLAAWVAFAGEPAYRKMLAASDAQQIKAIAPLFQEHLGVDERAATLKATSLLANIQGAWLLHLTAPQTHGRETLHTLCQSYIDATAQPVASEPKRAAPARKPKPSKPKLAKPTPPKDTAQMDFEDLLQSAKRG